jgi:hypothetical protein
MESKLVPGFVYTDISPDITEADIDVVSDLWTMDGREVYRGSRDPRYTHANVYWLYDEDLQRVGCSEHTLTNPGDMRLLWFHESPFGTLFQEEWTVGGELWSQLPTKPFERFINEGWTTAESFLEHCLYGPTRVVTMKMLQSWPKMYLCAHCGKKSLRNSITCAMTERDLDVPQLEKVLFVDEDMVLHVPPPESVVFTRLRQPGAGGFQRASLPLAAQPEPELEPEPEPEPQTPPPQTETLQPEHSSPPQSRPRTPELPSDAGEAQPEHA